MIAKLALLGTTPAPVTPLDIEFHVNSIVSTPRGCEFTTPTNVRTLTQGGVGSKFGTVGTAAGANSVSVYVPLFTSADSGYFDVFLNGVLAYNIAFGAGAPAVLNHTMPSVSPGDLIQVYLQEG